MDNKNRTKTTRKNCDNKNHDLVNDSHSLDVNSSKVHLNSTLNKIIESEFIEGFK